MNKRTEQLKTDLLTGNAQQVQFITDQLFTEGEFKYLLELLQHKDSSIRNAVALTFKEKHYQGALEPLLKVIQREGFKNTRGTLVYVLRALDCSKNLNTLFNILFSAVNNWEVQDGILTILNEQEFEFTREELHSIEVSWNEIIEDWNSVNGIDGKPTRFQIDDKIITETVDGFLAYLKTEE